MLIAARNSFLMGGAKLPYDAEVEYLEGVSGGYIDTGVIGSNAIILDAAWGYASASSMAAIFGARTSSTDRAYAVTGFGFLANQCLYVNYGVTSNYLYYMDTDVYLHRWSIHLESGMSWLARNGVNVLTNTSYVGDFSTAGTVLVLGLRDSSTIRSCDGGRIYSFRFSGGAARDFTPVRVGSGSSAVGYLYDRANPTGGPLGNGLYPNAGTGAFVIGPDKS